MFGQQYIVGGALKSFAQEKNLQRSGSSSKMSTAELPCYTLINVPSDFETPNEMQLKQDLEKGNTKEKIEALKKTIYMILNGEKIQGLLMNIIRSF